MRGSTTICQKHLSKVYEYFVNNATFLFVHIVFAPRNAKPILQQSSSAKGQDGIKCVVQKDYIEMEKSINPKYQEIASYTIAHKAVMKKSSLERTTAIDEH